MIHIKSLFAATAVFSAAYSGALTASAQEAPKPVWSIVNNTSSSLRCSVSKDNKSWSISSDIQPKSDLFVSKSVKSGFVHCDSPVEENVYPIEIGRRYQFVREKTNSPVKLVEVDNS